MRVTIKAVEIVVCSNAENTASIRSVLSEKVRGADVVYSMGPDTWGGF